ncbi:ABC transporter ATP-binding protein [Pseudooceanicola sp. CBS1P-1]|uniref:ATP-binding cassette domain-containing protein n=1 Tax=Pseudooceanicola albus TaxID=2692189 RepID=A0A6L7G0F4_9RHOB|nr:MULTISPECIES: ABC transporter ATP-binding protein [Pseudooceanicola]MBT9383564.1 ABC transporter ATP-binding protein [Pseudooceanicola endophyticus]MXN17419.1 ATP-binding cassette domain-containing protein [Pseudooceanicola albus]
MSNGASIELGHVGISFGTAQIVSNVNLDIKPGEFVCLLGPSGCGKSTLLNAIAGFLPVAGSISVGGDRVTKPGLDRGVVFQSAEVLFPWLTIRENVEYGLKIRGVAKAERAKKAEHFIGMVGLAHAADKFPKELSGGMRQRAQIARVLINEPSVVLMDEPFGALDAQTREVLQEELDRLWRKTGCTIVFVTHDIWEALLLADRVVVMTAGPRAGIKTIQPIDLPHPRDAASPECLELFRRLRDDIGEEVKRALEQQGLNREEEPAT